MISLGSISKNHQDFLSLRKSLLEATREKVFAIINADFLSFIKSSDLSFFKKNQDAIILFTNIFNSGHPARNEENFYCLRENLNNKYIKQIILYIDEQNPVSLPKEIADSKKLKIIYASNDVSFLDFFSYFKSNFSHREICLISNCDCYFDSSLNILHHIDFNSGKKIFCCTRKELNEDGVITYAKSIDPRDEYKNKRNNLDISSSDCFIIPFSFKEEDVLSNSYIGDINIEFSFLSQCFINGYTIQNLFCFLNCIHIHQSQIRTKHRYKFNSVNLIYPNKLLNPVSEKNYIFGTWRLRNKYNYIDENSEVQNFAKYLPINSSSFMSLKDKVKESLVFQKKICLFYLVTKQEVESNLFYNSIVSFFNLLPSLSYKIKVFCFIDSFTPEIENIKHNILRNLIYKSHIADLEFHNLDIPKDKNIYIKDFNKYKDLQQKPELGQSSGPNLMFFKSMGFLKKTEYENFILLESDCQCLKSYWLDSFLDFVDNNDFTVSGSQYSGLNKYNYKQYFSQHINGSAIYRNRKELHDLVENSRLLIESGIKNGKVTHKNTQQEIHGMFSFDVALFVMHENSKKTHFYLKNNLFSILTDPADHTVTKTEVLSENKNCIILHQKSTTLWA